MGKAAQPKKQLRKGPTPFENRVYSACRCIPAGRVSTYGALAAALGSAPRAVGQALKKNPFAPEVPCHRVIAASLELGGFHGSWGPQCVDGQRKLELLRGEGVRWTAGGKLEDASQVVGATELRAAIDKRSQGDGGKASPLVE